MGAERAKVHTTFDISKICGVYPTTVAKWIDKGLLKASVTPGGHRRVSHDELLKFLDKHSMSVPMLSETSATAEDKRNKILIVDDNKNVLSAIQKALVSSGKNYKIKCVEDGFSAGQAVIDMAPSLVILDIKLPGIDGFEVCRLIKSRNRRIKILAISGYGTDDVTKSALAAGADAFMAKPFGLNELLSQVERMLSK